MTRGGFSVENISTRLEGIKVLSFARALAGPYTTMLLCDLGAEVIKIEGPRTGDIARWDGPFIQGISSYFLSDECHDIVDRFSCHDIVDKRLINVVCN